MTTSSVTIMNRSRIMFSARAHSIPLLQTLAKSHIISCRHPPTFLDCKPTISTVLSILFFRSNTPQPNRCSCYHCSAIEYSDNKEDSNALYYKKNWQTVLFHPKHDFFNGWASFIQSMTSSMDGFSFSSIFPCSA